MLEKTKLLIGAYYLKKPIFAQIDELFQYIQDDGTITKENLTPIQIQFLEEQITKMKESYLQLEKEKPNVVHMTQEEFYQVFQNMIDRFYEEFNLTCERPNIQIVKHFPYPFEKANFEAMNFNEHQAQKYGCEQGIYLLEKYTAHGISEIMLAHELMHAVIGNRTPKEEQTSTAPFFEEATVDLLGLYFLLKYHFIDEICLQNWISFGRGNCDERCIGSLYFKEAKQMLWILKTGGIEEVKRLARKGQGFLAQFDMKDYFDKMVINPEDETTRKLISYYDYVFTNFNLNVTEYHVLSQLLQIEDGKTLVELDVPNMTKQELQNTIDQLIKKGLMYRYEEKFYNPNRAISDTIRITLIE